MTNQKPSERVLNEMRAVKYKKSVEYELSVGLGAAVKILDEQCDEIKELRGRIRSLEMDKVLCDDCPEDCEDEDCLEHG